MHVHDLPKIKFCSCATRPYAHFAYLDIAYYSLLMTNETISVDDPARKSCWWFVPLQLDVANCRSYAID